MELNDTLEYWAAYMAAENLTERTVRERLYFIRRVAREAGNLDTVTRAELIRWMGAQKNWSATTRVHYRSALHTFFTWLQDEGLRADNPAVRLPKVRTVKRQPTPIAVDDIQLLLESGIYAKTRAMVALHYYLGLRVSEIAAVHGSAVNRNQRTLAVVGKGNKPRTLPIHSAAWAVFEAMPPDAYWFPNRVANRKYQAGQGHILGNSVSALLNAAIKRAGLSHRAHDLRAATATEMNRAKVSAFVVQQGMRHEQMDTTNRYLGIDVEQIREGLEHLPVLRMPDRSGRRSNRRTTGYGPNDDCAA